MSTSSRISAFLAYLLLINGWLYVFLFRREDRLATYHTKQSMMITVAAVGIALVWGIAGWLISLIPFIGFITAVAIFAIVIAVEVFLFFSWLVGIVYALQARFKPVPVVGTWAELIFGA